MPVPGHSCWLRAKSKQLGGGEDWAEMYSSHYVAPGYWNDVKPTPGFVESPQIGAVEVIPEPSTILVLLCGLGGLVWRRRR